MDNREGEQTVPNPSWRYWNQNNTRKPRIMGLVSWFQPYADLLENFFASHLMEFWRFTCILGPLSKWKKNVCQVSLVRFVSCQKMSISILRKKKKNLNSISIVEELNNIFEPLKLWKYYIYFLEKCNQDIYLQKINLLCIFNILNIEIIKKLLHFKYNEIFLSFFSSDLDKCLIERFWYAYAINFII